MKQYEAVVQAMQQNGGYATLGQLYKTAILIPECNWLSKTPFASIRRIVQTKPALFFRIAPGLWGLFNEKERILQNLNLAPDSPVEKSEEFGHSYYQGLVVEIGNARGYQTYVPRQDRNKVFLQDTLGSVTTLPHLPTFTYDALLKRAKMVDVSWFNERQLPNAFFEIEHTTDINNSLLKFLEFQDFRTKTFIVASPLRLREFGHKLQSSAFLPIRDSVHFLDYSALSDLHTKVIAADIAKQHLHL